MQSKLEAENFLRRVQVEYAHLIPLGYRAIINSTVIGMKNLGIFSDNLNEAKFLAGLQNAMDTGLVPKPPIQVQTVVVEAPLTSEQIEQQRLAAEESARQKKVGDQLANERAAGRINHAVRQSERASLRENVRGTLMPAAQLQAKALAEDLKAYTPQGKINWSITKQLQEIFVWTDSSKVAVDWINTLSLRKKLQTAADNDARNRHNNR
jgi:hypothetical protein